MAGVTEALFVLSVVAAALGERYDVVDDVAGDVLAVLEAASAEGFLAEHLAPIALAGAATLALVTMEQRTLPGLTFAPAWWTEAGVLCRHQLTAATVPSCSARST